MSLFHTVSIVRVDIDSIFTDACTYIYITIIIIVIVIVLIILIIIVLTYILIELYE